MRRPPFAYRRTSNTTPASAIQRTAAACMIIALAVGETSVVLFYGQAAAVVWMALAGVVLLVRR